MPLLPRVEISLLKIQGMGAHHSSVQGASPGCSLLRQGGLFLQTDGRDRSMLSHPRVLHLLPEKSAVSFGLTQNSLHHDQALQSWVVLSVGFSRRPKWGSATHLVFLRESCLPEVTVSLLHPLLLISCEPELGH